MRATSLTGMSCSASYCGYDLGLDATEGGHSVPNRSPGFSSLPLFGISHGRPAAILKPAPAENLIHAGGSRCMEVRPMLCAMAAGGALVLQGNAVAW
jgi:hypothetical protein